MNKVEPRSERLSSRTITLDPTLIGGIIEPNNARQLKITFPVQVVESSNLHSEIEKLEASDFAKEVMHSRVSRDLDRLLVMEAFEKMTVKP